jgi:hypothetical protein
MVRAVIEKQRLCASHSFSLASGVALFFAYDDEAIALVTLARLRSLPAPLAMRSEEGPPI